MKNFLLISQSIVATLLIISILLQKSASAFGESGFYFTRRGLEKKIFWATIILGVLFVGLALLGLIL